jgi:hypothetical protein
MVQWTVSNSDSSGLEAEYRITPAGMNGLQNLQVTVESRDAEGAPRNGLRTTVALTDTTGSSINLPMSQSSPGVYVGTAKGLSQGVYETEILQRAGGEGDLIAREAGGLVVPYSSEFAVVENRKQVSSAFLSDIAQLGGGQVLSLETVGPVWKHNLQAQPMRIPMWPWLLLAAIILFPLDVAVRRLTVSWKDLRLPARPSREGI